MAASCSVPFLKYRLMVLESSFIVFKTNSQQTQFAAHDESSDSDRISHQRQLCWFIDIFMKWFLFADCDEIRTNDPEPEPPWKIACLSLAVHRRNSA